MGKAWVKARLHDRFYRAARKQEYRSRSAIKLSQIDHRIGLFRERGYFKGARRDEVIRGADTSRSTLPSPRDAPN